MDEKRYKIGAVSRMTGLPAYVLRFWETEFPGLRPQKSRGNQRVYTQAEIATVQQIKTLLYEERLTIEGARKKMAGSQDMSVPPTAPSEARGVYHTLNWVRGELQELLHLIR